MKALIVRLSSIGDVVHTLPVLAALHRKGWEAGWIVEAPGSPLLDGQPMLTHVVAAPTAREFRVRAPGSAVRAAGGAVHAIRAHRYDVALDVQGLWKSAAWARLSGAPKILGYAGPWRRESLSTMLVREPVHSVPDVPHVIDKNLALLRSLGIDAVGCREFPLPPTDGQAGTVSEGLAALGLSDFVILNPGGGWPSKLWPPGGYGAVARGLKERALRPLVTWGPGEERLADNVLAASEGAAVKCFPTTLLEYVELARRARLVVAADTGPLHIACALGTPVVGIYGPTDPARNGPFSARDVVVRRKPLCSPCHRRRWCGVHEGVMEAIPATDVLRAIDERLAIPRAARLAV